MNKIKIQRIALASLLGLFAIALLVVGCRTSHSEHSDAAKPVAMADAKSSGKGSAQLWAENCVRCHNVRSPSTYSDAEWDVAMMHMRTRANLTAEESKKILEFLKSAN